MPRRSHRVPLLAGVLLLVGCSVPVDARVATGRHVRDRGDAPSRRGCAAHHRGVRRHPGHLAVRLPRLAPHRRPGPARRIASPAGTTPGSRSTGRGRATQCVVSGPAIGGPTSLAPGRYRLAGVGSIVSDVASPGFSQMPILGTTVRCDRDLLVLPETTGIAIHVTFGEGSCTIDVTTR